MLREQGSINCLKELFPAEEAGRPYIDSVESLDTDNDVPIGGVRRHKREPLATKY